MASEAHAQDSTRLEHAAEAGMGADTMPHEASTSLDAEKGENRADTSSPSHSSDVVVSEKHDGPPEPPPMGKLKIALIMASLMIAVFLAALDITIVTTALPTISAVFKTSEADYTWIGSAYLLAAAAGGPTWGKISDIWGRKPIILVANVVFFVGSLIAALSTSIKMLIAGRVIQGIGGGGLVILPNICISDLFSQRERGKYFGMIGMVWGLASAVGPLLGGVFTEKVTWRWCFYINLPFDGLAFIILFFFLDIETPTTPLLAGLKAVDWLGTITIVGGTIMFLLGLEYGGVSYPWSSPTVICLILFGVITWVIFAINQWKFAAYPTMPVRLFNNRSSVACFGVCFIHGFVFISGAYYLPLYFQSVFAATPILSGVYVLPYVLSLSFCSAAVGILIKKTGIYLLPIQIGLLLMTLGFGLFIDLPNHRGGWARVIIFQIIAGLGTGPNFQAPLIALQTGVLPKDIATATATFGFVRNIATSMSIVIGGVIFQNQMKKKADTLAGALGPETGNAISGGNAGSSTRVVASLPEAQRLVAQKAYTDSLQTMWIFYVAVAAVGVATSLLISKRVLSKVHQQQKQGLEAQDAERREREQRKKEKRNSALSPPPVLADPEKEEGGSNSRVTSPTLREDTPS